MTIFQRMGRSFKSLFAPSHPSSNPDATTPSGSPVEVMENGEFKVVYIHDGENFRPILITPTSSGVSTNEMNVQAIDTVWACARALAEPIAMLDISVVQKLPGGKQPRPEHRLQYMINDQPNSYQTKNVYFERALYHMVLWGEHFAQIRRNGLNEIIGYYLIHPRDVTDYRFDEETGLIWWFIAATGEWVPSFDMIHVPILNDRVRGRSVITQYREDFGHTIAVRNYGSGFFASGGKPNNWVETIDAQINRDQNKQFVDEFRAMNARGGSLLLPYGRKLHQHSFPPDDAQVLQTAQFDVEKICRLFNVPQPMVQALRDANYNNLESLDRSFAKWSLEPYNEKIEKEYTVKSFTPGEIARGFAIEFSFDKLLKADPLTRAQFNRSAIQNGWRTINEVRSQDGFAPVEGGDRPLIQQNMAHLDTLDELNENRNNGNTSETDSQVDDIESNGRQQLAEL